MRARQVTITESHSQTIKILIIIFIILLDGPPGMRHRPFFSSLKRDKALLFLESVKNWQS